MAGMGDDWYRLVLQLLYNSMDLTARLTTPLLSPYVHTRFLAPGAIIRIVLVPLFWLSVYKEFDFWWLPMTLTVIMGYSNGLLASLCMMRGPTVVDVHERQMAGMYMSIFLMFGIIVGATIQLGISQVFASGNDAYGNVVGACTTATANISTNTSILNMTIIF